MHLHVAVHALEEGGKILPHDLAVFVRVEGVEDGEVGLPQVALHHAVGGRRASGHLSFFLSFFLSRLFLSASLALLDFVVYL